jgi:hypothetical protein
MLPQVGMLIATVLDIGQEVAGAIKVFVLSVEEDSNK